MFFFLSSLLGSWDVVNSSHITRKIKFCARNFSKNVVVFFFLFVILEEEKHACVQSL